MKLPSIITMILTGSIPSSLVAAVQLVHLADCTINYFYDTKPLETVLQSKMIYYPDMASTSSPPNPLNVGRIFNENGNINNGLTKWEVWVDRPDNSQEQFVVAEFLDGNHVKAFINADAGSWPVDTISGDAINDWGKRFRCKKSARDGTTLFTQAQYLADSHKIETCFSKYRCEA
ncbi:hypothetical protein HDU97_003763 [Phlyctochytrium planicorne]|nr:hypothetical protein HDU97_003763 [Phlyctochytrium planicorne]